MKKIHIIWLILIISFILFLIFILMPKNYTKKYKINEVEIKESYNKNIDAYYFEFKYKDIVLSYLFESKFLQHQKFIKKINIIKDEDDFCIIPESKEIKFNPLCYQDNKIVHFILVNESLKKKLPQKLFSNNKQIAKYNDIEIYNNEFTYYIWNYNGFIHINENKKEKINIFDKEQYTINLVGYTKDYLVIADYDSNYTFNNLYTIDINNGKLKKYELDRNIYFDSYFIGYQKNKSYIVDNKEKLMYEFNSKNGELEKIESKILKANKWKKVGIKTLINKKVEFEYLSNYEYKLKKGKMYLNYKNKNNEILISEDIKSIVRIKDKDIFYIKGDSLYHFNDIDGEEKLLSYFEWNFNYENMIYID